jgi:omega-6 fatty acid desaturase (delta-12 desaturase)
VLADYREPDSMRSVAEIAVTVIPFIALWAFMGVAVGSGYWVALLLVLPAAGLLVRMFMIQHDCGHGAFFRHRLANDWTGRVLGVLTLTPYDFWQRTHAEHHAGSGNLDRRGMGDVHTLTVEEYWALGGWSRLRYRLYRHPLVMFGLGPAYLFFLQHRLPVGLMRGDLKLWASVMGTNLAIGLVAALLIWLLDLRTFALVHLPVTLIAATAGIWLFFVQHQFENTNWEDSRDWKWHEAALHGSSHYDLPPILRWFTANIGVHHVHHLSSRIPFYRLQQVLRDHPELGTIGRLSLGESLRCVRLVLWDAASRRLVSFREAGHASKALPAWPH